LLISSPSSASSEPQRAAISADRLNGEFDGRVYVEPIWRHAVFLDQIAKAADCDIMIALFGRRPGTNLPGGFLRQPLKRPPPQSLRR
jgi:hypothetical protein